MHTYRQQKISRVLLNGYHTLNTQDSSISCLTDLMHLHGLEHFKQLVQQAKTLYERE